MSNEILPQLVYSLSEQNVSYKNSNFENMKLLFLTTILIFIF